MESADVESDLVNILFTEAQIQDKLRELAKEIEADYVGKDILIVGILRGAVMVMADLARALNRHVEMDWMAVSSYGSGTKSSGVVRILKDLDHDIEGRDVLVVEDIIDSGLTLNYLLKNLRTRRPASLEVVGLLQKTSVQQVELEIRYEGFTIPPDFVVGYGLDFDERFRNLPYIALLKPEAYSGAPA